MLRLQVLLRRLRRGRPVLHPRPAPAAGHEARVAVGVLRAEGQESVESVLLLAAAVLHEEHAVPCPDTLL